jgi:hypothetical protein
MPKRVKYEYGLQLWWHRKSDKSLNEYNEAIIGWAMHVFKTISKRITQVTNCIKIL